LNPLLLVLLIGSFVYMQCAIGGTRLLFSLPAYALLATASFLTLFAVRRNQAKPSLWCLLASTAFFGYVLARAVWSPIPYLAWADFFSVIGCLMAYLLTAYYLTGTRERFWLIFALLGLAAVQVLVGLRQFTGGDDFMLFGQAFELWRAPVGRRASGFFISPIHFAGFLEAIGAFALAFALWSRRPGWARALLGYLAVMCYVGIAITGSRGGYLSVIFSLAVFGLAGLWVVRQWDRARFGKTALLGALAFVVVLGAAAGVMSRSHLLNRRLELIGSQFQQGGLDIRIYNWQATLDQFRVSPWVGTGAGTHLYYGRLFRRPQLQADPEHAHSDYLELLAEYGLIGFTAMAVFLFVHFRSGLRTIGWFTRNDLPDDYGRARSDGLALQIGALTALASYLAHSVVDFNLHIPSNALLFAVIFGIVASPGTSDQAREPEISRWFRFALPALGVWLCIAGLPKLPGEYWTEKARVALRNRRFAEAIEFGQKALVHEKRNPHLYFYLGEAHRAYANALSVRAMRRPYLETAAAFFQEGLQLFPQEENLWIRLGQTLDGLQRFDEAEAAYLEALKWDPNLWVLRQFYAAHLRAQGYAAEAAEQEALTQALRGAQKTSAENAPVSADEPLRPNAAEALPPPR
jgi:O-antigen ligase